MKCLSPRYRQILHGAVAALVAIASLGSVSPAVADYRWPGVHVVCIPEAGIFSLRVLWVHVTYLPENRRLTWDEFSRGGHAFYFNEAEPIQVTSCKLANADIEVSTRYDERATPLTGPAGFHEGPNARVTVNGEAVRFPAPRTNFDRDGWFALAVFNKTDRVIDILDFGRGVGITACETQREYKAEGNSAVVGARYRYVRVCEQTDLPKRN